MGGGVANKQQANQADAAAMKSSQASADLSNENLGEQKQNFNYLFGSNGKPGSLTPMMDPNSLNVSSPTGAYKAQLTNTLGTLNNSYNNQRGTLAQAWANSGSANGMPNGFMADQQRALGRDQANANGSAFVDATTKQYQDSLSNFWNANSLASGQASGARSGALEGASNSGSTASSIYGTAGQYHQGVGAQLAGSAMQAGGQVGAAAMCPAVGSRIRTNEGDKPAEGLRKGDLLLQKSGAFSPLEEDAYAFEGTGVRTTTLQGRTSRTTESHTWSVPSGGYVEAHEASAQWICTEDKDELVAAAVPIGPGMFVRLKVRGDRTYLCDGFWSLA